VKPVKPFFVAALCALSLAAPTLVLADSVSDSNSNPPTNSQPGATPGSYHHHGMGAMLKSLNLTPQQQDQIKTLISNYKQAHPEGSQPDPAAKQQLHQQILNVLTPEQRTKLEQEKAQWKQHHVEQGPAASPVPK
jgi:Spy/CpxP family protein refolding chaperone